MMTPEDARSWLVGRKVVLTGTLGSMTRRTAEQHLSNLGATIQGNVTRSTQLLVAGDKPGSKLDMANRYGITIWTEADFDRVINATISAAKPATPQPKVLPDHYGSF